MTSINIELHDDVMDIISKIRNTNDLGIVLFVPEGALLFENIINIKLLEKEAERLGKSLNIDTKDLNGQRLIKLSRDEEIADFKSREVNPDETEIKPKHKKKFPIALPSLAGIKLPPIKLPKAEGGPPKIVLVTLLLLVLLGLGGYMALSRMHKAEVVIDVKSQPLTKSIQITADSTGTNSAQQKSLKGHQVETLISEKVTVPTTGEKIIGETASGKVTIYNKTTSDKNLKKGTVLTADKDDLEYVLDQDIEVEARTEDPVTKVITPGSADANIVAREIGEEYNIKDDEDLAVDNYSKSDVSAETNGNLSGGKSETVKVVTEEDILLAKEEVTQKITEISDERLKSAVLSGRSLIQGSGQSSVKNEILSAEVDEEADELELTREVLITGLTYSSKDLDDLINELLDEFIPEGYILSSQDMDINAEVLGNTDSTVLSTTKADLQVTVKTYVITDIKEDDVKSSLAGKSLKDGQAILDRIQNINNYSLNMTPNLPFLKKFPGKLENINVEIKRT